MDLSIVIASWNTSDLLAGCLHSIPDGADGLDYRVIVVDNASTDGSPDMVTRDFPSVHLIRNAENAGFAGANNQGIRRSADARYVLLLNSDTVVPPDALTRLVRFMDDHPQVGAVGPRLVRPDGSPQAYAFGRDPTPGYLVARGLNQILFHRFLHDWATSQIHPVHWVSGACLLVRQEVIAQAGLLDENMFMYFEDNDWCLRIRTAGWQIVYNPSVSVIHLGGQSVARNPRAQRAYTASLHYFYAKHYGSLARLLLKILLVVYRPMARS